MPSKHIKLRNNKQKHKKTTKYKQMTQKQYHIQQKQKTRITQKHKIHAKPETTNNKQEISIIKPSKAKNAIKLNQKTNKTTKTKYAQQIQKQYD